MAATFRVDIVSAEKEIFSGEAEMIVASAELGEVGIAPGHTPLITRMKRLFQCKLKKMSCMQ